MPFLYFSFHIDTMLLGVPAQAVIELTRAPDLSRVPGAPGHVRGLINLRGKLAIAVDLRKGLPAQVLNMNNTSVFFWRSTAS